MSDSARSAYEDAVAVIGMAGRFPGARDVEELWRNLRAGTESITHFTPAGEPGVRRVGARGILDDLELFDADLFGINPKEAELIDPQHRHFLECAWLALADAGYDSKSYDGAIAVFGGSGFNYYLINHVLPNPERVGPVHSTLILIANSPDFLTSRVSFKLDLRGPSVAVQTACSTSLVAVHLACRCLLDGECDMALAGGVSITLPQRAALVYQEGGVVSPDGRCRAFDAAAAGTVPANGCGVVLLKRWRDALADGDHVRALVRGSAASNDGAAKVGFAAPSAAGQARAIREALALAQVEVETIQYVEAHGTGTVLGDPIEIAALTAAFASERRSFCAVGSVKTNLGHLDVAAGVTGMIKTVLALERRELPASLHYEAPNPKIDFSHSPFFVNTALTPWLQDGGSPRRAGVSSFGIGGTNVHLILEEAPAPGAAACQEVFDAPAPGDAERPEQLFVLSARTDAGLKQATADLAAWLEAHPAVRPEDAAFTLQVGRRAFSHRLAVLAADGADAAAGLRGGQRQRQRRWSAVEPGGRRQVAFLFPGQGTAWLAASRDLYRSERAFRRELDACFAILGPGLGGSLAELVAAPAAPAAGPPAVLETAVAQPLLFAAEYALARLWQQWLGAPWAMLGHSLGEYVAACLAGVFSLEEGLRLVAERGRLLQELPAGAMLAVALPEAETRLLLDGELSLAAVNGAARCVVSGPVAAVEGLRRRLGPRQGGCKLLDASRAFHSAMMEPAAGRLRELFAGLRLQAPRIPYLSNVTGTWIRDEEATDPDYWCRHLCGPVRFHEGLTELLGEPDTLLLEMGPEATLTGFARRHPAASAARPALSCWQPGREDGASGSLLAALGRMWLAGATVHWPAVAAGRRQRRVSLPVAPLERRRHWIDSVSASRRQAAAAAEPLRRPEPAPPPPASPVAGGEPGAVEEGIARVFCGLLGIAAGELDRDAPLHELGADSLLLVQANDEIRRQLGCGPPLERFLEGAMSVADIAAEVAQALAPPGQEVGVAPAEDREAAWARE